MLGTAARAPRLSLQRLGAAAARARAVRATASPPPAAAAAAFRGGSEAELAAWLRALRLDPAAWGTTAPGSKPLAALLGEVRAGESALEAVGGTPLRRVAVVNVRLHDAAGRLLVEAVQVLPGGAVRARGGPLAEKMLPGESWRAAALRGVAEELGAGARVELDDATHTRTEEERASSQSYPGLRTRYECHSVEGAAPGLPAESFETVEGELIHRWEWR